VILAAVDADRLRAWLLDALDVSGDSFAVEVISGGRSNLTLGVQVGGRHLVVRRPPLGHFLPTAHDMSREYRVYRALHATPVPVPEAFAMCEDPSVIGAPFYVMQRMYGVVPHEPAALAHVDPDANARTAAHFVEVLAAVHGTDVDAVGLGDLGRRSGYLERQVRRWVEQWQRAKDRDEPVIDALAESLQHAMPVQGDTTLVHGDYRLGNVMLDAADTGRVVAVFDWEMATLGDPMSDLGYTLLWWGTVDRAAIHPSQQIADLPGFPSAQELAARYATVSGRDVTDVPWHMALAAFKLAVIGEGQRATMRRAGQEVPTTSGQPLAEWALDLLVKQGSRR
jgi:aminoglycoside phosphotransferase (APT) family kinase protein